MVCHLLRFFLRHLSLVIPSAKWGVLSAHVCCSAGPEEVFRLWQQDGSSVLLDRGCLVLPQEGTWCHSLLTSVKEVWSDTLQTATTALTPPTALTPLPKLVTGPCLDKQRGAALCWTEGEHLGSPTSYILCLCSALCSSPFLLDLGQV